MFGRGLVKRVGAMAVMSACAFVVVVALGATVYYGLSLIAPPLAAAAITAALFALIALVVGMVFFNKAAGDEDEEESHEPMGLGARAYTLFKQRPILGTVAALAGGWIFLRNPALATMVAAAFSESGHKRLR